MRKMLFRYLGSNNVVVGWHVGWTLASIGVSLPASRVVDLGTEKSVQWWCREMVEADPHWKNFFVQQHLVTSVDRRLPAMLRGFELNTPRRDDVVAESIYTAAVWQTVAKVVSDHRMLPDVYKV